MKGEAEGPSEKLEVFRCVLFGEGEREGGRDGKRDDHLFFNFVNSVGMFILYERKSTLILFRDFSSFYTRCSCSRSILLLFSFPHVLLSTPTKLDIG